MDPRRDERRKAILRAAWDVFYEEGYQGASMSAICARLGGSKGTLYNYFENKEQLFEAVVRAKCMSFAEGVFSIVDDDMPVREVLAHAGESFVEQFQEPVLRFIRMVIAEAQRSPELARIFYECAPKATAVRLAHNLEIAKARGEIVVDDCLAAAEQFLALCRGSLYFQRLLNIAPPPDHEHARAEVRGAVEIFMKAYGPS